MHASALADHTPQAARLDGELSEVLGPLLAAQGPVHCHFTDRVFGPDPSSAAQTLERIAARGPLSVTVHDVPQPSDGRSFPQRCDAYARVLAAAHTVIVSSRVERDMLARYASLPPGTLVHVDPLPVDRLPPGGHDAARLGSEPRVPTVGILGFLYPGKGHAEVLAALETSGRPADVVALGRVSDGHDDLVAQLESTAARGGRKFHLTGFLSEEELTAAARAVTVPVVAPTHVSASGSVGRWIATGRRPVVTRHPFFEELHERAPWALTLTDDLSGALPAALADPGGTWIAPDAWDDAALPSTESAARTQWEHVTSSRPASAGSAAHRAAPTGEVGA